MKYKVEIEFDDEQIKSLISTEMDKQIKVKTRQAVINAFDEYAQKWFESYESANEMDKIFTEAVLNSVVAYASKRVNTLFQDLEDQLFIRKQKFNGYALNFDVSKEEQAFYEGLYIAFLAKSKLFDDSIWNKNIEAGLLESVSRKIFEDIKEGGYKRIAYYLTKQYDRLHNETNL